MKRIYRPTERPEDWKNLLADEKHWKPGHSAYALAHCWEEADGFPEDIKNVFNNSGITLFQNIQPLLVVPEYRVPLPGGKRDSQNDIFVLARVPSHLVSIMVEGKVSESFDKTVQEWQKDKGDGKEKRLIFLRETLSLESASIDEIRYQLLHRTASALIVAAQFMAISALMLVHSFSQKDAGFDDYARFLELFGLRKSSVSVNSVVHAKNIKGIDLYFGWVKGNEKYLG